MMKNNLIIFSKNRASQLNLLIDSINKNSNDLFDNISVLFKTDIEYSKGYSLLIKEHKNINFINETNFRDNLLSLINDDYTMTTFMVDDAVIFKKITSPKTEILKTIDDSVVCFSLRLGFNCVYSHPANIFYKIGDFIVENNFIIFDYKKQSGDFGYPLSTDGHIFKTSLIKKLLFNINFSNPNTLETNLQYFVSTNQIPTNMYSFSESKLVSIPVNIINTTYNNRHGLEYYISEKELNDKFINNEIIDFEKLDFDNINGPHKEIKYIFKNANK